MALAGNPMVSGGASPPPRWIGLDQLEIGEQLGAGGGGFVHRAIWKEDGQPEQTVAVKLFRDSATVTGRPIK